jgi:hypothetical protein
VVLSPVLLTQLERMQRGYRIVRPGAGTVAVPPGTGGAADAGRLLGQLRSIASRRTTELEALPFGDVSIPAILDAGFGKQLAPLIAEGASIVQTSLTPSQTQGAALGPTLSSSVVRPVGSALDPESLAQLVAHGARILLIDPGFVPTQVGLPFSPPALARLTGSAGRAATAILPDTGVAAAATQDAADPVLAAHAALGEMAASYFEFPGTAGRGVAMLFPERPSQPAGFFPAIAGLVASSPWLRTVTATAFAGTLPAPTSTERLTSREFTTFDPAYLAQLKAARAALRQFEVTVIGDERQKDALTSDLHQCIAGTFVTSPALGARYVQRVQATIARTYAAITLPPDGAIVTLTSRRGTLPLTIRNSSTYDLRARIKLLADPRITFDGGGSRIVQIPPGNTPLEFSVNAQTTGRFPMAIRVETLDGSRIAGTQMIVRSTAYNRVALLVTIGAGLFLAIWWGRRFLPRRMS